MNTNVPTLQFNEDRCKTQECAMILESIRWSVNRQPPTRTEPKEITQNPVKLVVPTSRYSEITKELVVPEGTTDSGLLELIYNFYQQKLPPEEQVHLVMTCDRLMVNAYMKATSRLSAMGGRALFKGVDEVEPGVWRLHLRN